MDNQYAVFQELKRKIADIEGAVALLNWDQETYIPSAGADFRARQVATLSGIQHEWQTSGQMEDLLFSLEKDNSLTPGQRQNVKECLKEFRRNKKLSTSFIEAKSKQISVCFHQWMEAREKEDYTLFAPELEKLIQLKQEEARLYGYSDHPYNALLELYEEENNISRLDELFSGVKTELKGLLEAIRQKPLPDNSFLHQEYPRQQQWDFSIALLKNMGYDFSRGRQDYVVHPFCTTISPDDVRVTTKADDTFLSPMIWGSIHEGGHALYEQGLSAAEYGMPLGQAISMAVHESQSRIWENNIGRGEAYWTHHFTDFQNRFPEQSRGLSLDRFLQGINRVEPSLIRIEADELTYHFHIMIRYELEKQLIGGTLHTSDLPEAWNRLYKEYLGIDVPDLKNGCLQDVHWSHGYFGYFPTYSQGSFMAAQWYATATRQIPNLEKEISSGNCIPMLSWLRENVHQYGKMHSSKELLERVTGEPLQLRHFMDYARRKYSTLYSL